MDLSKVLDDLYDSDDGKVTSRPLPSEGPDWSDENRLDEVFASWKPGPPSDAPAAEREMAESISPASMGPDVTGLDVTDPDVTDPDVTDMDEELAPSLPPIPELSELPGPASSRDGRLSEPLAADAMEEDLGSYLSEGGRAASAPEPPPPSVPVPVADGAGWSRSDDDVLTGRPGGGRGGLRIPLLRR